jgi:hypothetical protein
MPGMLQHPGPLIHHDGNTDQQRRQHAAMVTSQDRGRAKSKKRRNAYSKPTLSSPGTVFGSEINIVPTYKVAVQLFLSLVSISGYDLNRAFIYSLHQDECPDDAFSTSRVIGHIRRSVVFHCRLDSLGRIVVFRDLAQTTTLRDIVKHATLIYEAPNGQLAACFPRPAAPNDKTEALALDTLVPYDHGRPKNDGLPRLALRSITNDSSFTLKDMHTSGHPAAIYSRCRDLTVNPLNGHSIIRMSAQL